MLDIIVIGGGPAGMTAALYAERNGRDALVIEKAGFGGIEQTVAERTNEDTYEYNITTQVDLGKLLPPKAKLSAPLYYSYAKKELQATGWV